MTLSTTAFNKMYGFFLNDHDKAFCADTAESKNQSNKKKFSKIARILIIQ